MYYAVSARARDYCIDPFNNYKQVHFCMDILMASIIEKNDKALIYFLIQHFLQSLLNVMDKYRIILLIQNKRIIMKYLVNIHLRIFYCSGANNYHSCDIHITTTKLNANFLFNNQYFQFIQQCSRSWAWDDRNTLIFCFHFGGGNPYTPPICLYNWLPLQ